MGNKVPGSNDTPLVEPSKAPSVEISEAPVAAAPFIISAPLPDPNDRDETPVNYYGIQAPRWQAQYVDENWTTEMTDAIDFTADFEEFCATTGCSAYRIDDPEVNFTQEDADAVDLTEDFYDYCRRTGQSPTVFSSAAR